MLKYQQSTGLLTTDNGIFVGKGYSGHKAGLNDPDMQWVHNVGPLPRGIYTIGTATDYLHLVLAMRLKPAPSNKMFDRSGFLIHGDNDAMNHTASDGCIIMPHGVRVYINSLEDRTLEVIA